MKQLYHSRVSRICFSVYLQSGISSEYDGKEAFSRILRYSWTSQFVGYLQGPTALTKCLKTSLWICSIKTKPTDLDFFFLFTFLLFTFSYLHSYLHFLIYKKKFQLFFWFNSQCLKMKQFLYILWMKPQAIGCWPWCLPTDSTWRAMLPSESSVCSLATQT